MSAKVLTGPFAGYTKAQLLALRAELQSDLANGRGTLTGSSVNGQSFSFQAGLTVSARLRLVNQALAQVDPDTFAPSSSVQVRFAAHS